MDSLPTAWAPQDGEEWELRHDLDGFTYKILKRQRLSDPSTAVPPLSVTDPEIEKKQRRQRKKNTLLKLKNRYQNEIRQWELLSNNLCAMQEKGEKQKQLNQTSLPSESGDSLLVEKSEDASGSVIDELLLQVEAQEAIIHDVSNLCDVVEAMCDAEQEQLVQSFIDLPVWSSPRELMASLCDDVFQEDIFVDQSEYFCLGVVPSHLPDGCEKLGRILIIVHGHSRVTFAKMKFAGLAEV